MNSIEGGFTGAQPQYDFANSILSKISYYKETSSSQICFENMKKIDKNFNENNFFALAYMATNPALPEAEREIFKKCLQIKLDENATQSIFPKNGVKDDE
jgi:hypothetical protein